MSEIENYARRLFKSDKTFSFLSNRDKGWVSFAFVNQVPKFSTLTDSVIIDIISNPIANAIIKDFPNLERLRISKCPNLTKITITNCPKLKVLDFIANPSLRQIKITNCDKIRTMDLSFCDNLTTIDAQNFLALRYLSISHTKINEVPLSPMLQFVDVSSSPIKDLEFFANCINLQALIANNLKISSVELSKFSFLSDFILVESDIPNISFEKFNSQSKLSLMWFPNSTTVTGITDFKFRSASLPGNKLEGEKFNEPKYSGSWHKDHHDLFGPWPPIENDVRPKTLPNIAAGVITGISKAAPYIAGCIFGLSVGDWLSWSFERLDKTYLNLILDEPINPSWSHIRMTRRCALTPRGAFSEQTALAILFIRSVCETQGKVDIQNLAKHIKRWSLEGMIEHKDGRGVATSSSFNSVTQSAEFEKDPLGCSKQYWERTGRTAGGNVCVSKTAPCGCLYFWDDDKIISQASDFCKITSYDLRCAFSSSLVSLFIGRLIRYRIGLEKTFSVEQTIEDCFAKFPELTKPQVDELRRFTRANTINDVNMNSYQQTTMLSMAICIIALKQNMPFKEGVEFAIRLGGDTNGNASVVSAVLGAKWGIDCIPDNLFEHIYYGGMLFRETESLLALMGIRA